MLRGVLLATASALLLSATPARADVNYTVTGTSDGTGSCTGSSCTTLRAAVATAVTGDTITLPAGDYSLTTTLTLSHGVIITGPETAQPTATIKPGPGDGDRVFDASIGGNENLTIEHVRITGASSDGGGGAALRTNSGTVTLDQDVIDGNGISVQGGALRLDGGVLDITDSVLSGNHSYQGGALFISAGTAVIHSSLFVANDGSTGGGGAIYNQVGFLEAYDSTFVANTVNSGVGGAIYTSASTTLRGDTFEQNIASGHFSGDPTFGGSALYASTPGVQIANVLFGDSGYLDNCEGNKPTDLGGSVDTGNSCGLTAGERTILLGPLADNGGPTPTLLPWANSQSLNTGADPYCSATDQRGVARQSPCDAGAVENSAATNAPAPVIDGVEVASTGNGSAAIDATIDRGGLITSYRVEYGTAAGAYTGDTGNQAVSYDPVGGAQAVEATLSGLTPATTYHYRVVASSPGGTTTGSDQTLTTAPAPTVTTGDATDLTDSTATLLGSINDHGTETGYYFEFGTTTAYGSTSPYGDLGAGDTDQPAQTGIDNLQPGTTYHVRLVASDPTTGSPVVYGQDRTFTTTGSNTSEYTVTDTGDPDNATCHPVTGGNLCTSLRAALAAVSGNATITLQDPGTYTLTHGQMYINGDVTIVGHSARDTTIDAGGQSRVFNIPNSDQLQLTSLTVTGGDALDEPGGDILNAGTLSMIHTRVTGGHAAVGGGVATEGAGATTSITSSLIDGNTAGYGAGVSARSNGDGATLALSDVTVTGNHGAGVLSDSRENSLQLVSATVARNDGEGVILEQGQPNSEVVDSIVADNGAANCSGKAQNIAFDVEDAASCGFTTTGSVQNADPQLSAALVNAGGQTDVLTIPGTSPANDLIAQCVMGVDQRDVDRLTPCDAGAFEYTGTVITGGPAGTTDDAAPAFTFDAPGGQTYECSLSGPGQDGAFGACSSPRSYAGLAPGDYVFSVRPAGGETVTRAFTVAPPQAGPSPTPTPGPAPTPTATPTPTPVPTPVAGKTVVAAPVSGTVLVQLPGTHAFVRVSAAEGIPLGSVVDTRHGVVQITATGGGVAKFYDGLFKVTQSGGVTILTLTEQLAPCGKGAKIAAKKPKSRKLWGDGHGAFSTRGQYSAATVRGTVWLVQDSCSGTLTRVKTGVVAVRDNVKKKTVLLKAGKSYVAKPKKKR